jgi:hypothetical protein
MMKEKRKRPRKVAGSNIQVFDANVNRRIGRLVNLTSAGLMLIGDAPMESNMVFQLELVLESPHYGKERLQFGVESLWCSEATESGRYWSGFHIIDISSETTELIELLVESWETDESSQ